MNANSGNPVVPEAVTAPGTELELAMRHLMSLSAGDQGVLEIIAAGESAVPGLCRLLFQREPSGLFQPTLPGGPGTCSARCARGTGGVPWDRS